MLTLYEFALSGNCHKVRLLLSLLGVGYQSQPVDAVARQHKSAGFLAMNPLGQVPMLCDGEHCLRDSQAILCYLARRYDPNEQWFPADPLVQARMVSWLSLAAGEVSRGPAALRLHHKWGRAIDTADAEAATQQVLTLLEARLREHDWLADTRPTLADVAVQPYLALAGEGRVSLAAWPATRRWLVRMAALPGYCAMPGMAAPAALAD